ncbi:CopD family protein [Roseovarius sp. B08]|uniref:CopD family protein n=1 Tax=Roseovarius sp. B08 TaxID=3449223 RepID=UPI003EDC98BD
MLEWFLSTIPIFKVVHIAALLIWCGGLLVLPLMLSQQTPAVSAQDYVTIRRMTHVIYTVCVTPAAVIAVIAGTWLIFMREVFVPWFYAKLAFVGLLVAVHAWLGHSLADSSEQPNEHRPASPVLLISAGLVPVLSILVLVLSKPDLTWIEFPEWLLAPRDGQLPFDVPSR